MYDCRKKSRNAVVVRSESLEKMEQNLSVMAIPFLGKAMSAILQGQFINMNALCSRNSRMENRE